MSRNERGVGVQVAESECLKRPATKAIRRHSEDVPKARGSHCEGIEPEPPGPRGACHTSNSEKGAPARLPEVITLVESAVHSKSLAVANASFLGTEWNSWTR